MANIADGVGKRDKACIKAFVNGHACDGYKLTTDGRELDGLWMGGKSIAVRATDGSVKFNDLGSRAAQTVQRAVLREMPGGRRRRGR